jgi:arylformamidase
MSAVSDIVQNSLPFFKEAYDVSAPLSSAPAYPGDRAYRQEWMARQEDGDGYSLSALSLGSHTGTHLDFSCHLQKSGKSQKDYSLNRFIIPAEVISVPGDCPVQPCNLPDGGIRKGQALLFQTANSQKRLMRQPSFSEEYVCLSADAARICALAKLDLVGIDYISVDRYEDAALPVHRILLESDVIILEGLDLSAVPSGRYLLICLPLKIDDAEASPVRAVLLR